MAPRLRVHGRSPRHSWFARFAKTVSRAAGRPTAFAAACVVIVAWGLTGPLFRYSDTW